MILKILLYLEYLTPERHSSSKNKNSLINYSPSCCSKPIRPWLIFEMQMKIFLMKSESFLTYIYSKGTTKFKAQKGSKDIVKTVNVTLAVRKLSNFIQNILICVFEDEQRSCGFGTT